MSTNGIDEPNLSPLPKRKPVPESLHSTQPEMSTPSPNLPLTNGDTQKQGLCPNCQNLQLSVDKFVIFNSNSRPLRKASPTNNDTNPRPPSFSLKSGNQTFKVGTLSEIQEKSSTCSFCFLVAQSAETSFYMTVPTADAVSEEKYVPCAPENWEQEYLQATCYVDWEIDGRDSDGAPGRKARTRRLHLHWDDKALKDSYLVFVAPQRLFEFNSDASGSWEREAFFLGRELRTDGNNQVLMKSWLDQCYMYHGDSCEGNQSREFCDMADQSYFGVIDVLDMCLKSLPRKEDKGRREEPVVIDVAPRERIRERYAYDRNPSLASDEVVVVEDRDGPSKSGIRYEPYVALSYVWGLRKNFTTDISNIRVHQQQGSLETSLGEIPKVIRDAMDLVRRLGLRYLWVDSLCIVQDSKRSWTLNSQKMNLIYGNALLTICAADGTDAWFGLEALNSSKHSTTQHIEECAPGVRLMVSKLAETGINSSVWNTRAWTFQERLLSKRCLIFTEGRVFFQCRQATMSEDLVSESHGAGWSLDLAKALPQILHELPRRPIRVYMSCMSRYSERKLTQAKDILAAFNGVSNLISDVMKAPFIFGLPSSHFDLALLWEPIQSVTRRVQQPGEDFQDMLFPSWSWCGWKGGKTEYRSCQLEGVLTNVHEWLTEHTWIAWYIRDGRGNLRPVWDGAKSIACDSVDRRWRGYKDETPEPELAHLQAEAMKIIGIPNEDDFITWSKEQKEAKKEEVVFELQRKRQQHHKHGNYETYEEQVAYPPPRQPYRHERQRSRSSGRSRGREVLIYRAGSPNGEEGDDPEAPRTLLDEYGRKIPFDTARRIRGGFQQCLPDNPFKVYIEKYTSHPDKDFPDQPLLQFWTWSASLRIALSKPAQPLQSEQTNGFTTSNTNTTGLNKYDIADNVGDWCGSIILDKNWVTSEEKKGHRVNGSKRDFLAISDAKAFTKEECDVWTYYVPKERENSEWDLYYVLLVERRDRIWYRVGLGKVFKAAFDNALMTKRWKEVIMG